jgi:hypothetical protein
VTHRSDRSSIEVKDIVWWAKELISSDISFHAATLPAVCPRSDTRKQQIIEKDVVYTVPSPVLEERDYRLPTGAVILSSIVRRDIHNTER